MFGLIFIGIPFLFILFAIKYIYNKHKIPILRFFIKFKDAKEDYAFMTNLSLGSFIGALLGLIVSSSVSHFAVLSLVSLMSFVAMIDFHYKSR